MLEEFSQKLPLDSIVIEPGRQRKNLNKIPELAGAIVRTGLLHPIIVRRQGLVLVAGERRLTAYKHLRSNFTGEPPNPWDSIPVRYLDTLDPRQLQIVEMEENVQREQFEWPEKAEAFLRIFELRAESIDKTADYLGMGRTAFSNQITVAEALRDPKHKDLAQCATISEALNRIKRTVALATANEVNKLVAFGKTLSLPEPSTPSPVPTASPASQAGESTSPEPQAPVDAPAPAPAAPAFSQSRPVINAEFEEWASAYTGEPFNFIHCDFPYGINHQKSQQGRVEEYGAYDDREEVYWSLLHALARHKSRLIYPSAHMIFWFSMKHYERTMIFMREHFPEFTFEDCPLIWVKRQGIAPDPQRRPQRNYETALFGWSSNRNIVKLCSNVALASPGIKHHASQKAPAALRQLFRLVVNEDTRLLDPTCGSGTALQAAKALGAAHVLGIERDPVFAKTANDLFEAAQVLSFGAAFDATLDEAFPDVEE